MIFKKWLKEREKKIKAKKFAKRMLEKAIKKKTAKIIHRHGLTCDDRKITGFKKKQKNFLGMRLEIILSSKYFQLSLLNKF